MNTDSLCVDALLLNVFWAGQDLSFTGLICKLLNSKLEAVEFKNMGVHVRVIFFVIQFIGIL